MQDHYYRRLVGSCRSAPNEDVSTDDQDLKDKQRLKSLLVSLSNDAVSFRV